MARAGASFNPHGKLELFFDVILILFDITSCSSLPTLAHQLPSDVRNSTMNRLLRIINGGDDINGYNKNKWWRRQQHNNQLIHSAIWNWGVKVGLHGGGGAHDVEAIGNVHNGNTATQRRQNNSHLVLNELIAAAAGAATNAFNCWWGGGWQNNNQILLKARARQREIAAGKREILLHLFWHYLHHVIMTINNQPMNFMIMLLSKHSQRFCSFHPIRFLPCPARLFACSRVRWSRWSTDSMRCFRAWVCLCLIDKGSFLLPNYEKDEIKCGILTWLFFRGTRKDETV